MNRFEAYYNLHKKCLSYRPTNGSEGVQHADIISMSNVSFAVQPAGRDRVRREKRKNVHAFVRGHLNFVNVTWEVEVDSTDSKFVEVTYNPYKYDSFVIKSTGEPIYSAREVVLSERRIWAVA